MEVTWKNGNLPDSLFEDFGLSVKLPDKPGETLWWKIVQECTKGEVAWVEIPKEGSAEPEHPAAGLVLTASEGDGHGHTDASADTPSVTSAAAVSSDDSSNVVSWLAMAVGALGLVAGASSFVMRRR